MKKSLVLGILGFATATVSGLGQGSIFLDTYQASNGPQQVVYSAVLGGGVVPASFTAGLYYDPTPNQNIVGSIASDPTGYADPSSLNSALVLATGTGSTAPFINSSGEFEAAASFNIQPGVTTPAQSSYTIMVVAYNGSSYDTSTIRGHSAPVYIQDSAPAVVYGSDVGFSFPPTATLFTVYSVPEPAALALGGLGLAALVLARSRKA